MRGRKPLPTNVHALHGFPGKRPPPPDEPKPDTARPDPPPHLDAIARDEWARVIDELVACDIMSKLDRAALAAYCWAYSKWVKACNDVSLYGTVMRTEKNYPMLSPFLNVADRAFDQMLKAGAELGLSPSSRTRIAAGQSKGDEGDEFDQLLAKQRA